MMAWRRQIVVLVLFCAIAALGGADPHFVAAIAPRLLADRGHDRGLFSTVGDGAVFVFGDANAANPSVVVAHPALKVVGSIDVELRGGATSLATDALAKIVKGSDLLFATRGLADSLDRLLETITPIELGNVAEIVVWASAGAPDRTIAVAEHAGAVPAATLVVAFGPGQVATGRVQRFNGVGADAILACDELAVAVAALGATSIDGFLGARGLVLRASSGHGPTMLLPSPAVAALLGSFHAADWLAIDEDIVRTWAEPSRPDIVERNLDRNLSFAPRLARDRREDDTGIDPLLHLLLQLHLRSSQPAP